MRQAHRRTIILGTVLLLLIAVGAWLAILYSRRRWQRQMQELIKEVEKALQSPLPLRESQRGSFPLKGEDSAQGLPLKGVGGSVVGGSEESFLMRVIEAVNEAMPQGNFGVEQIAAELGMSVQTFRRRLFDAAGESPKSFIQAIQMERAVKLLSEKPDLPISQVANLCGFDEASSFGHTFRRIYGCSPSEYKKTR